MAATCGSNIVSAWAMPPMFADTARNWSRSRPIHPGRWRLRLGAAVADEPHATDRVRKCGRPGRRRLRREPARPGGNGTGFIQFESSLSGKWLQLLKEIAPGVTRAAVLRDAATTAGAGQFAVIQSVASSVGAEVIPINVHDAGEIERSVTSFARSANGGL